MNTVSHSESQALHAVAAAAAVAAAGEAITVPVAVPYELHLIALSKLRPSARNVRKSGGTAIPELAASIVRVGLLQNLTVIASPDGEHFEVVAGKRRLAALKLLAKRRKLGRDHPVPCLLVPDASAVPDDIRSAAISVFPNLVTGLACQSHTPFTTTNVADTSGLNHEHESQSLHR